MINSNLSALLSWSNQVNSYNDVPIESHDLLINTIVSDSGALGTLFIPYNSYGTYLFGGWGDNYAILEYQSDIFDISLYLNGTTCQHRAYTILYR